MDITVERRDGASVQEAVDRVASAGGGRVSLEPGEYPCATIWLRSNVELNIPAGARLVGSPRPDDYEDFLDPGLDAVAPEGSRKCLQACRDAENVAVTGGGEIDGQGPLFYDRDVPPGRSYAKPPHPRTRMAQFFRCRNVRFEGVTFRDSPGWTFWLVGCEDVHVRAIRIDGDQRMINNDGIDIDSCRRVTVSDSFFRTGDDCLILRAIRRTPDEPSVCEDVVVTNCVLDSWCQGVRVGCPSDDTIRHAIFSNIVCRSRNGIFFENPVRYLRRGDTGYLNASDIRFSNWDLECREIPIRINVEDGIALRGVERIVFSGMRIRAGKPIHICGNAGTQLREVSLRDISGTIDADAPLVARSVEGLEIDGFRMTTGRGDARQLERTPSSSWETQF